MNLPGYDAWKTDSPFDMSAEQEAALEAEQAMQEQSLRDAVACALIDERGELRLADVRRIVGEELEKLHALPGEPVISA